MIEATLCFPIKGHPITEVLLGLKKLGLGEGKYDGFGGKIEPGETVEAAAVRELAEEAGIVASEQALEWMGRLVFVFPCKPEWSQVVHVFTVRAWAGCPAESAEMNPAWFPAGEIPYHTMWQDGPHWLPLVLAGQSVQGTFTFKADNETVDTAEIETGDRDRGRR